jgi:hypothetical protein
VYWSGQERVVFGFVAFPATALLVLTAWLVASVWSDAGQPSAFFAGLVLADVLVLAAMVKYTKWVWSTTTTRAVGILGLTMLVYVVLVGTISVVAWLVLT